MSTTQGTTPVAVGDTRSATGVHVVTVASGGIGAPLELTSSEARALGVQLLERSAKVDEANATQGSLIPAPKDSAIPSPDERPAGYKYKPKLRWYRAAPSDYRCGSNASGHELRVWRESSIGTKPWSASIGDKLYGTSYWSKSDAQIALETELGLV